VPPTQAPETNYDSLGDGLAAQLARHEAVQPETSLERRDSLADSVEVHCARNTEVMVLLASASDRHAAEPRLRCVAHRLID
jgi:hypothetical protein